LRPLASTGTRRSELMPEVPTMKESGIDIEVTVWYGVMAPSATPQPVIEKLAAAIARAAHAPDIRQRLIEHGAEPVGNTPEEFARILRAESVTWADAVRSSGAKADE
jgi:tripartite-type tricarboxylate transporter receptor subunit TctC